MSTEIYHVASNDDKGNLKKQPHVKIAARERPGGRTVAAVLVSIVVSIPACHAGDRGSIPRRGGNTPFLVSALSCRQA